MTEEQKIFLHQKLREQRKICGKSQDAVAKAVHIQRTTLSNYETGKRFPPIEIICDLADYYGVDASYLLFADVGGGGLDDTSKHKLTEFKFLIKGRFLDIGELSPIGKIELLDYYNYLLKKEMRTNTEQKKKTS